MRDPEIRQALLSWVQESNVDDPETLIIEELGLNYGDARVDIGVVNGEIHGFEIKSDRDTLRRLPNQMDVYNTILDKVTVVCGERYAGKIEQHIPEWWGIVLATKRDDRLPAIQQIRSPQLNGEIDPVALASLIWRDEALCILERIGAARGYRGKPRPRLYQRLAEVLSIEELGTEVRATLKYRKNWRSARRLP